MVATGAAYDHLPGTEDVGIRLRRVRLQMLETGPFAPRVTTALADADTLRYYPAYDVAPLELLGEQGTVAGDHHLQLLLVQRPDGGLTIGDTHAYEEPFDFALSEEPTDELLRGPGGCWGRSCRRCGGAGRACTPSAPTARCACGRRSTPGSSW